MSSRFRQAFAINFASQSGITALNFVVSVLMAHLLTPAELGVYAITLVFVNIAHVLRDFGVSAWLQREPELGPEKIRSAFGLLCASSGLMALLLFVGSWSLSHYFAHAKLRSLMQVLALGFVIVPFSAVMAALKLREFAAAQIARVSLIGAAAFAVMGLGLAYLGFGAMSLAWAHVANIVACSLAYVPLRPEGLWPSLQRWQAILRFGLGSILSNMLAAVNSALPDLLLGKLGSSTQVGLMGRANATVNLFASITGTALNFGSLSYLAAAHHQRGAIGDVLNRAMALLTGLAWPALALSCLFGREIVLLLFGPQWLDCVPAIAPLALAAAIGLTFNFTGTALAAIGRPGLTAIPMAVTALARVGLALFFFDGGLTTFAWLMLGAALMALPAQLFLHARFLGQPPASIVKALYPSLLVTVVCALVPLPLAPLAWFASVRLTRHELTAELHQLVPRLRSTIRK